MLVSVFFRNRLFILIKAYYLCTFSLQFNFFWALAQVDNIINVKSN